MAPVCQNQLCQRVKLGSACLLLPFQPLWDFLGRACADLAEMVSDATSRDQDQHAKQDFMAARRPALGCARQKSLGLAKTGARWREGSSDISIIKHGRAHAHVVIAAAWPNANALNSGATPWFVQVQGIASWRCRCVGHLVFLVVETKRS